MKVLHKGKALLIKLDKIDKEVLDKYPDLEVIGTSTTGLCHIDLDECKKRGIEIISLGTEPRDEETREFMETITSTVDHTMGLMIALARNYKTAFNFPYKNREYYKGLTLRSKILGVIGYGRIGRRVAEIAKSLGMKVFYWDKKGHLDDLELMDIVSLHIPLQGNEGFFTKEMFKQMKPTAYLINTSRDGVIEKGALLWALENKEIAGAAIDFIDDLDLVEYSKYNDNLILTNHIGGCTDDMDRTHQFMLNKINNYINYAVSNKKT